MSSASRHSSFQAASCRWSLSRLTRSLNRERLAWCLARLWRTVQAIFSNSSATAWARFNSRRERTMMSFAAGRFQRLIKYPIAAMTAKATGTGI